MSELTFHKEHREKFRTISCPPQPAVGHAVQAWAKWLLSNASAAQKLPEINIDALPNARVNREEVFNAVRNKQMSTASCCLIITAWGAMRWDHGPRAFGAYDLWGEIAEQTRAGKIGRHEAYKMFRQLRPKKLPCMGPAYFTKLIYFLMVDRPNLGFIMDQWSARSMNLLVSPNTLVEVDVSRSKDKLEVSVSDRNTETNYEHFCKGVEQLGREMCCSPDAIEERLFSKGGRNKGDWRKYLISLHLADSLCDSVAT
ncbi:MAG: hypothetical protein AABM33_07645 [Pseudomonadota bacterium]